MLNKKIVFGLIGFGVFFQSTLSRAEPFSLRFEPLVGYERVQQVLPQSHFVNRLMYGGRIMAGVLLLSAETEYTHGEATEEFSGVSIKQTGDRVKLGLRSGFRLGRLITISARGGAQGSQEKIEQTVGGVTSSFTNSIVYNPYAGVAVRASLTSKISASADAVAIVPSLSDLNQTEYQVTAGFAIKLP